MRNVISVRLGREHMERLQKAARALDCTPAEAAATFVEEGLRLREFPGVEFRDTALGRQAYLRGTRWTVWQAMSTVRAFSGDTQAVAESFYITPDEIAQALAYDRAYPEDINAAIADSEAAGDRLAAMLPRGHVIDV